jgi:hypothetical protein
MQRLVLRLCTFAAAMCLTNASQANLIVNGNFENFIVGPNDIVFTGFVRFFSPPPNTDITGWTITGSTGGNPNNVDDVNTSLYPAFSGATDSLDMEGDVGASGVINQSFATTPGVTYNLSFAYANNPDNPGTGAMANVLVTGAGVLLSQDVSHNGSTFTNMNYLLFSQDFVANSALTTLQYSALTNTGFGIALDAVDIESLSSAVPDRLRLFCWLQVCCAFWGSSVAGQLPEPLRVLDVVSRGPSAPSPKDA